MTHDGLLHDAGDPDEGAATLALIERMIGHIGTHRQFASPEEELARDWHDDMIWWGPEGIGATYTRARYIEQHQQPFRRHMERRQFNGHVARLAEGAYGGFFGWPNLTLDVRPGYLGGPGGRSEMRVVDLYRRSGDRLAENWVYIDIPHFLALQGRDPLPGAPGRDG